MTRAGTRTVVVGSLIGALVLSLGMPAPAGAYPRPGATERVSVSSDGVEANPPSSSSPAISADGRHIVFASPASNLVPGDTNMTTDIFVRDRGTAETERVSIASDGSQAAGTSFSNPPAISADGRHVAFASNASNLVPEDTNGASADIFVHDRETGETERVSVASDGTQANGRSSDASISADGRYVAFASSASNLTPADANGAADIFVHDRQTAETERVSVASDGTEANSTSSFSAISADGRHVAFASEASNLVPGDTNGAPVGAGRFFDIFVHDRETGETERVSVASDGTEANSSSFWVTISAEGRYVGFFSSASNLVPDDSNGAGDIFVHDRETGETERVSVASDGTEANSSSSTFPAISAGGRHVAFASGASNLVPGDTNATTDVFVRDRGTAIGVARLSAAVISGEVVVSGWATFSGATATSADDDPDDGEGVGPLVAQLVGAEIVSGSVLYRVEAEDLLLRLRLASLPGPVVGGAPAVLYRWSFTARETAYEVRAHRAAVTGTTPAAPFFALYECATSCAEVTQLSGGIGTAGNEVRASVPLEALGADEGTELTALEASAALGEAGHGALEVLDDVELPDASIPVPRVEFGIAPPSVPEASVSFTAQAELVEGRFSGTLDVSSLPPGAHRVWARACLSEACGARSVEVTL